MELLFLLFLVAFGPPGLMYVLLDPNGDGSVKKYNRCFPDFGFGTKRIMWMVPWLFSKDKAVGLAKPVFRIGIFTGPSRQKFLKKLKNYIAIFRGKRYNSLNKGLWQENGLIPI